MAKTRDGIIMIIISMIGFFAVLFLLARVNNPHLDAKTEGFVVDYEEHHDDDGDMYSIVVEYEVDGEFYRVYSPARTNRPKSLGTKIKVKYNSENPKNALIVDPSETGMTAWIIISSLFFIVGVFVIIRDIKNKYPKTKEIG